MGEDLRIWIKEPSRLDFMDFMFLYEKAGRRWYSFLNMFDLESETSSITLHELISHLVTIPKKLAEGRDFVRRVSGHDLVFSGDYREDEEKRLRSEGYVEIYDIVKNMEIVLEKYKKEG